jgi:galactokinase
MKYVSKVYTRFIELFAEKPLLVRSPGRVNLLGEHTDYNQGFVLPAAIDKAIYFALTPREDRTCRIVALDLEDEYQFSIDDLRSSPKGWPNYLMGVVDQLVKGRYRFKGFNCVFGGDIPLGAGLSSSAAIEAGLLFALNVLFELKIEDMTIVKLAQKAENDFVGVRCGIMDQFINVFGESGNVLRIDCRSLEYKYFPFQHPDVAIVLFDTRVSHSLASSEYNTRRSECSAGVDVIQQKYVHVTHLRDVSREMLEACKPQLSSTVYMRCKYVVEENERVEKACAVLEKVDLHSFGRFMYDTHDGLSRDYEVSCKELDFLVQSVRSYADVYGARMMGGGFGGCTINLIEKQCVESIAQDVSRKYKNEFNIDIHTYVTSISSGTSIITINEKELTSIT